MQNLEFKYIRAKNFICFGPDGIEIDLTTGSNIIHVTGENLDQKDQEDDKVGSNGSGKSSIPDILVYALFGKTIKGRRRKINHSDVVHRLTGKGLEVEVHWDNYKVIRTRDPNSIEFWVNEDGKWVNQTPGGRPSNTQDEIEKHLGLNYDTFLNVVIFTDSHEDSFLEADTPAKREIVENLLSLGVYREYFEEAKSMKNKAKDVVNDLGNEYERLLKAYEQIEKRVRKVEIESKDWKQAQIEEFNELIKRAKAKKVELESTDEGFLLTRFKEAQAKLKHFNDQTPVLYDNLAKLNAFLEKADTKQEGLRERMNASSKELAKLDISKVSIEEGMQKAKDEINRLSGAEEGSRCPTCLGVVNSENYQHVVIKRQEEVSNYEQQLIKLESHIDKLKISFAQIEEASQKLVEGIVLARQKREKTSDKLVEIRNEIIELQKVKEPNVKTSHRLLEQEISEIKKQAIEKRDKIKGPSPFADIMRDSQKELEEKDKECGLKKREIERAEALLPYYDYYNTAFGDAGIRKFVIEDIIPSLNTRIVWWLHFLFNSKYTLKFDSQLKETIQTNPPDGKDFVYRLLSRSQKRRMNLTVSQSFADVMMIDVGISPNIVFLDEVSSSIDSTGILGVYNMIHELSKNKKVFVTTHDPALKELLNGCEKLKLRYEKGVSRKI